MKAILSLIALSVAVLAATPADAGRVYVVKGTYSGFDVYTDTASPETQNWFRNNYSRMKVYAPYFDAKTSWYPNALIYVDSYAAYRDRTTFGAWPASQHPDWILRDAWGHPLYIPWGCGGGVCPQYAADFSHPGWRQFWVDSVRSLLARGNYKGLWVDDVNLDFRVGDGWGNFVAPVDRNTGALMTQDAWRRYMAEFMEKIRADLPGIEIMHNSIWYAGGDSGRDANPHIQRQIAAADVVNIEHGVNDGGLTGGSGEWSVRAVLGYVERLNALGKRVVIDGLAQGNAADAAARDYTIACHFLVSNGNNAVGDWAMVTSPDNWPRVLNVNLGAAVTGRYDWSGLMRRDFERGLVLVNEPGAPWSTVTLPYGYRTVDGAPVSTVTLGPKQGLALVR